MNELIILTEIHNLEAGIIIIIFLLGYNVRMNEKKELYGFGTILSCSLLVERWYGGVVKRRGSTVILTGFLFQLSCPLCEFGIIIIAL